MVGLSLSSNPLTTRSLRTKARSPVPALRQTALQTITEATYISHRSTHPWSCLCPLHKLKLARAQQQPQRCCACPFVVPEAQGLSTSPVLANKGQPNIKQQHHSMCPPEHATIGNGVAVRRSSIPNAGLGLWTQRAFARNTLISEYCGEIISHATAKQLRAAGRHSHIRALSCQHSYIDGCRVPQPGLGGASFANDARDRRRNNAVFHVRFDHACGRHRVFLRAAQDLAPGTEVLVSYGSTYWLVAQQQQQQQQHYKQHSYRTRRCLTAGTAAAAVEQKQQQQPTQQQLQTAGQPLLAHDYGTRSSTRPRSSQTVQPAAVTPTPTPASSRVAVTAAAAAAVSGAPDTPAPLRRAAADAAAEGSRLLQLGGSSGTPATTNQHGQQRQQERPPGRQRSRRALFVSASADTAWLSHPAVQGAVADAVLAVAAQEPLLAVSSAPAAKRRCRQRSGGCVAL